MLLRLAIVALAAVTVSGSDHAAEDTSVSTEAAGPIDENFELAEIHSAQDEAASSEEIPFVDASQESMPENDEHESEEARSRRYHYAEHGGHEIKLDQYERDESEHEEPEDQHWFDHSILQPAEKKTDEPANDNDAPAEKPITAGSALDVEEGTATAPGVDTSPQAAVEEKAESQEGSPTAVAQKQSQQQPEVDPGTDHSLAEMQVEGAKDGPSDGSPVEQPSAVLPDSHVQGEDSAAAEVAGKIVGELQSHVKTLRDQVQTSETKARETEQKSQEYVANVEKVQSSLTFIDDVVKQFDDNINKDSENIQNAISSILNEEGTTGEGGGSKLKEPVAAVPGDDQAASASSLTGTLQQDVEQLRRVYSQGGNEPGMFWDKLVHANNKVLEDEGETATSISCVQRPEAAPSVFAEESTGDDVGRSSSLIQESNEEVASAGPCGSPVKGPDGQWTCELPTCSLAFHGTGLANLIAKSSDISPEDAVNLFGKGCTPEPCMWTKDQLTALLAHPETDAQAKALQQRISGSSAAGHASSSAKPLSSSTGAVAGGEAAQSEEAIHILKGGAPNKVTEMSTAAAGGGPNKVMQMPPAAVGGDLHGAMGAATEGGGPNAVIGGTAAGGGPNKGMEMAPAAAGGGLHGAMGAGTEGGGPNGVIGATAAGGAAGAGSNGVISGTMGAGTAGGGPNGVIGASAAGGGSNGVIGVSREGGGPNRVMSASAAGGGSNGVMSTSPGGGGSGLSAKGSNKFADGPFAGDFPTLNSLSPVISSGQSSVGGGIGGGGVGGEAHQDHVLKEERVEFSEAADYPTNASAWRNPYDSFEKKSGASLGEVHQGPGKREQPDNNVASGAEIQQLRQALKDQQAQIDRLLAAQAASAAKADQTHNMGPGNLQSPNMVSNETQAKKTRQNVWLDGRGFVSLPSVVTNLTQEARPTASSLAEGLEERVPFKVSLGEFDKTKELARPTEAPKANQIEANAKEAVRAKVLGAKVLKPFPHNADSAPKLKKPIATNSKDASSRAKARKLPTAKAPAASGRRPNVLKNSSQPIGPPSTSAELDASGSEKAEDQLSRFLEMRQEQTAVAASLAEVQQEHVKKFLELRQQAAAAVAAI